MVLSAKQKAFRLGVRAESLAAWYLRFQGFSILERRYRTRYGEIDIIARRGTLVLIVEVKARNDIIDAMVAVTKRSQDRIEAAAVYWLGRQKENGRLRLRYDLIIITKKFFPLHIKNFF